MFFQVKKEETAANKQFKKNCTYHGLQIVVSLRVLHYLNLVVNASAAGNGVAAFEDIPTTALNALERRGLVRAVDDGIVVTQNGLLVFALGESGGLVSVKKKAAKA